jgi:Rad3-related DNA helicase
LVNRSNDEIDLIVNQTLERVRKKLLDLSRRNNLINFKETRRTIRIIDELPNETFRLLVTEGKSMELQPFAPPDETECQAQDDETLTKEMLPLEREQKADPMGQSKDAADSDEENQTVTEADNFGLPEPTADPDTRHTDLCLQTPLLDKPLERRCKNILRSWRTGIDETGMNFLYLAMGFLDWYEDDNSDVLNRAPLILVPVRIERTRLNRKTDCYTYVINYSEEDIESNLSLAEMLENNFDLVLPGLMEDTKPEDYFERVNRTIERKRRWRVAREMILGFFSFAKIRIYRDLHDDIWPDASKISKHRIVREVLIGREDGNGGSHLTYGEEYEIDGDPYAEDIPLILDADSSQHSALLDAVMNEKNLVIEGPPGTGKSQTITNLIAAALHEDKTILFVSEKKAALEVVRNRLDAADLGDFCLELHSHKTQKGKLHADLAKRINQQYPDNWKLDYELKEFGKERDRLRTHYGLLNSVPGETKETIFEILWGAERWRGMIDGTPLRLDIDNALDLTRSQVNDIAAALKDLVRLFSELPEEIIEVWQEFKPNKVLLPDDAHEIFEQLSNIRESTESYAEYTQSVSERCGEKIVNTINGLLELTKVNTSALAGKPEKWDESLALSLLQDQVLETLEKLIAAVEKHRNLASEADKVLANHQEWTREDLTKLEQSAKQLESSGFGDSTPDQLKNLADKASLTKKILNKFTSAAEPIHDFFPEPPEKLSEIASIVKIHNILEKAPVDISLEAHPKHALKIARSLKETAHQKHQELAEALTELIDYFLLDQVPDVEEISRISQALRACTSWFTRVLSSEYGNAKRALRVFLKDP